MTHEIHNYDLHLNNYAIRIEMHEGRKHLVVPAIMMREGVHHGSAGPLLHLAEELGKYTSAWNGIPVTIQHPQKEGMYVSANSPEIIEANKVGVIFNTHMEGDKLKTEVWIDEAKIQRVSPETLSAIVNRRPLDVSVGVFTDDEDTTGVWNGEDYTSIARNHRPDHLALLPGVQGACSWSDGCGIRNHKKGGDLLTDEIQTNALTYSGTESTSWETPTLADFGFEGNWESLSQSEKGKVAGHYLIGSASVETFGDLHFPVVNPSTGNLNERALRAVIGGRGAQLTAVPANIRDTARRRAYRLLNGEFDAELEIPETLSAITQLKKEGYAIFQVNQGVGYREIVDSIRSKLDSMDTDTKIYFLQEVYEDSFIYEVRHNGDSTLYQRPYSKDSNGNIEFEGEPAEVIREITFKLKNNKGGVTTMCDENKKCAGLSAKVDCLIKNNTNFKEEDRELLSTYSEEQLDKLVEVAGSKTETKVEPQMNEAQAIQVLKDHLSDPDKFMGLLPEETRAQMKYGMKAYQKQRVEFIEHISANSEVYAKEELEGKPIDELEKLAKLVKPIVDYSMQGGKVYHSVSADDMLLPAGVEAE